MEEDLRRAFVGGRVFTMDPRTPHAEVVVVQGGRILDVGPVGILERHPDVERVELGGRALMPGLIDAHNHLSLAALYGRWADLSTVTSVEQLAEVLHEHAGAEPDTEWVRGAGWDDFAADVMPDRHALDAIGLDRPIMVSHRTLHQCVVDSRGLEALGIGRSTPDPPGGMIVREPDGQPTGLLVERAWSEAHARSVAAYADPDRWGEHIVARAQVLLREGVTCIHDAACSPLAEGVYRALVRDGRLPLSVLVMPHALAMLRPDLGERLDGEPTGEGDEWLRVGPVKLFADGGVAPAVEIGEGDDAVRVGLAFDDIGDHLVAAVERGWRVAVHAVGNVGVAIALDAFERAAKRCPGIDHRFRMEHVGMARSPQVARMRDLDVVACLQPGIVHDLGDVFQHPMFAPLRDEPWLPFADLAEAGIAIAASSDDPCAPFPPLQNAAWGTTRLTRSGALFRPSQGLPFNDWLRAYTLGAAYAGGQEDERGSISVGKRADLVVLDGELSPTSPPTVGQTWVDGKLVFER